MCDAIETSFVCWHRLDRADGYLIRRVSAAASEDDGVYLDANGHVPAFPSPAAVRAFAAQAGIALAAEEPVLHDLDAVAAWVRRADVQTIDCPACLDAWELFSDVARSVGADFDSDVAATRTVCDLLFWGNSAPPMTRVRAGFEPAWTTGQVKQIADILATGLAIFRTHVVRAT